MDKDKIRKASQEDLAMAQRLAGLIGTPEWNAILRIVEKRFLTIVSKWNTHSCPKCEVKNLKDGIEKEAVSLIQRGERSKDILKLTE